MWLAWTAAHFSFSINFLPAEEKQGKKGKRIATVTVPLLPAKQKSRPQREKNKSGS